MENGRATTLVTPTLKQAPEWDGILAWALDYH